MKPTVLRLIPAFALACALVCPLPSQAQERVGKFGMVDMEQLLLNSEIGKKALAPLNELLKSTQAEAERMHAETQQIRDQAILLTKTPTPGSQQALAALQEKFSNAMSAMQRFEGAARQVIDKQRAQSLSEFNRAAMPVIQALGKEQGYTMIFRKHESGLLYADEAGDLTAQLIPRLVGAPAAPK